MSNSNLPWSRASTVQPHQQRQPQRQQHNQSTGALTMTAMQNHNARNFKSRHNRREDFMETMSEYSEASTIVPFNPSEHTYMRMNQRQVTIRDISRAIKYGETYPCSYSRNPGEPRILVTYQEFVIIMEETARSLFNSEEDTNDIESMSRRVVTVYKDNSIDPLSGPEYQAWKNLMREIICCGMNNIHGDAGTITTMLTQFHESSDVSLEKVLAWSSSKNNNQLPRNYTLLVAATCFELTAVVQQLLAFGADPKVLLQFRRNAAISAPHYLLKNNKLFRRHHEIASSLHNEPVEALIEHL